MSRRTFLRLTNHDERLQAVPCALSFIGSQIAKALETFVQATPIRLEQAKANAACEARLEGFGFPYRSAPPRPSHPR